MASTIGTFVPLASLRSSRPDLAAEAHGTFADGAIFTEWLARTGQSVWQMLPIGETHLEPGSRSKHVPSPYKSYGIGIDPRFVPAAEAEAQPEEAELAAFQQQHADWLPDYALFCAIRDEFGTDDWRTWPAGLRDHDLVTLDVWRADHAGEIRAALVQQWRAHRSFVAMHAVARERGIKLAGDVPYYIPVQSPLVWANRHAFDLTDDGSMLRVSGVPYSVDSLYGRQVWGHPLYRWSDAEGVLALWKLRLRHAAMLYDTVRIDHALGFYSFGVLDTEEPARDTYAAGGGEAALEEVITAARGFGLSPFVEDSGNAVSDVISKPLQRMQVPGIRVVRFGYNEKLRRLSDYHADPRRYPANSIAFTSTHDTEPLIAFLSRLGPLTKVRMGLHSGTGLFAPDETRAARLRDAVLAAPSSVAIVTLQDWLLVPDRINVPGTELAVDDPNWRWRMPVPIEDLPDVGAKEKSP